MSMSIRQHQLIQQCFDQSNAGSIHFGEVIQKLLHAKITSYFVDYRATHTIYYGQDNETVCCDFDAHLTVINRQFDAAMIQQAIRAAQSGQVMYPEFKQLIMQAGCIGYFVWITGKKVDYLGAQGQIHTEYFPQ